MHDRGYGHFDNDPIGDMPAEQWVEIQRQGSRPVAEDPVTDLVAAMHIRRLLGDPSDDEIPEESRLRQELDRLLPQLRTTARVDEVGARQADRVTQLCDRIAFDFCLEQPAEGEALVTGRGKEEPVRYALDGDGNVSVDPWPFSVPAISGLIMAYQGDRYPHELVPAPTVFQVQECAFA